MNVEVKTMVQHNKKNPLFYVKQNWVLFYHSMKNRGTNATFGFETPKNIPVGVFQQPGICRGQNIQTHKLIEIIQLFYTVS